MGRWVGSKSSERSEWKKGEIKKKGPKANFRMVSTQNFKICTRDTQKPSLRDRLDFFWNNNKMRNNLKN